MTQLVVQTQTILDESPAEVQTFFEVYLKQLGVEAQISKLRGRRDGLAKTLKKKREKISARLSDTRAKLREGEAIPEDEAQSYKGGHTEFLKIGREIRAVYRKKNCSSNDIKDFRQAGELYHVDATDLALHITGKTQVDPIDRLDPAILARIEELRKKKI
jgi:predicted aminopeptidase